MQGGDQTGRSGALSAITSEEAGRDEDGFDEKEEEEEEAGKAEEGEEGDDEDEDREREEKEEGEEANEELEEHDDDPSKVKEGDCQAKGFRPNPKADAKAPYDNAEGTMFQFRFIISSNLLAS